MSNQDVNARAPAGDATVMDTSGVYQFYPPPPRVRRWPWIAAVVVAAAASSGITLAVTADGGGSTPKPLFAAQGAGQAPLRRAFDACHSGDLEDGDRTLVVDTTGEDVGSGSVGIDGLYCTLDELDTPDSVVAKLGRTRALDGMMSATWDDFEATWTYHPDAGLDVIITQRD
jgi:hypothetical protein